jgi:hypothetical protein
VNTFYNQHSRLAQVAPEADAPLNPQTNKTTLWFISVLEYAARILGLSAVMTTRWMWKTERSQNVKGCENKGLCRLIKERRVKMASLRRTAGQTRWIYSWLISYTIFESNVPVVLTATLPKRAINWRVATTLSDKQNPRSTTHNLPRYFLISLFIW